jgi:two-component system chemotaxis sensor kinase CheA
MDIVRQTVQLLNGSITLSSKPGEGTTFRIRVPLTLAILEGLSLKIANETYIVPLTSIIESLRPLPAELSKISGRHEVVCVRGEVLRILRLHEFFGIEGAEKDPCKAILVIVESEGNKLALLVDELITQNQAVIKSLEANYQKVEGITGATILGDGKVALIIDVPGLLRGMKSDASAQRAA